MAESIVQRKLNRLIQEELSQYLTASQRGRLAYMLTISQVRVTADLSLARVYVSVFPDAQLQGTVQGLNDRDWEIRHHLAGRIRNKVRKIPELRFYADDSFSEADRINALIDKLDIPPEDAEEES